MMMYQVFMSIKNLSGERDRIGSNASIYKAFPNEKKVYYIKDEALYLKEYGYWVENLDYEEAYEKYQEEYFERA